MDCDICVGGIWPQGAICPNCDKDDLELLTQETITDFAYRTADAILLELKGRIGFLRWWNNVDFENQADIVQEIKSIIEKGIRSEKTT